MPPKFTMDAPTALAYLVGQLSHIESRMYAVQYKHITYPDVVPVSNEAGEAATSITYFFMDGRTVAKFVGTNSLDVPIAEIGTDKVTISVELGAIGYQYSDEELRQAVFLAKPLPQLKANMARRGYEELAQRVCMVGDVTHNLPGFINNTNVTDSLVVDPGGGTEWVNKTPRQKLFDVNDLMGGIFVDTLQVERPDTLALPTAQWNNIAGEPRSDNSDLTTLKWLVANSPYLKSEADVISLTELAGEGAGGTDRMIAYTKHIDKLVFHIPMPFKPTEPQRKGLGFEVPAAFKLSGVHWRFPGSGRYGDGI